MDRRMHRLFILSAKHPAQHSAAAAQDKDGKEVSRYLVHALVDNQGNHDKNGEIQSAH